MQKKGKCSAVSFNYYFRCVVIISLTQSELIEYISADPDSLMFLIVMPQCSSMEMKYLATLVTDEC